MKQEKTQTPIHEEGKLNELDINKKAVIELSTLVKSLSEENRRAKMQIADLIEALQPFADMSNEFSSTKLNQNIEVFQYNDKKIMTSDFVRALDLIHYLSHHQIK